jgi:two-component sensor histidine kinase/PAS domain-containing protein
MRPEVGVADRTINGAVIYFKRRPARLFSVQISKRNPVRNSGSNWGGQTASAYEVVVSTLHDPVLILNEDLVIESVNAAFVQAFRINIDEAVGCRLYELRKGQWNFPGLRAVIDGVISDGVPVRDYRLDQEFEEIGRRVLLLNVHSVCHEGGEPRFVLAIRDNTELEFAKEYSEKIVDALRDPFLVLDWELRVKTANAPFYTTFQVEPNETEGRYVYELGNGEWDIPRLRELLEQILPRDHSFDDFEVEHTFREIGRRVMLLNARRIDHLKLILLVIEDATEARRAAAQQRLVLGELQHRVKNLLMKVRSLSQLTMRGASSLESYAESFEGRLNAMARTQDLLVRESGASARLEEIVRLELQAAGASEGSTFTLSGPRLRLSDRASHAFAMTIHELATNAAKYGALSKNAANGRVELEWTAQQIGIGETPLSFRWKEHGLVSPPTKVGNGFGTQIIESSLPYLFGGSSRVAFHSDGVECVMKMRLPPEELVIENTTQA